jgi:hypothetical protein
MFAMSEDDFDDIEQHHTTYRMQYGTLSYPPPLRQIEKYEREFTPLSFSGSENDEINVCAPHFATKNF